MIRTQTTTKEKCLELDGAYWKWSLYVLPLTQKQITRNYYHAKAFYNIHTDLLETWKATFIEKLKLSSKDAELLNNLK